jgi:hypothetical protein
VLTKLVNENRIDWDEHTVIFIHNYIQNSNMVYTISISVWITSINAHNVIPVPSGDERDSTLVRV